MKNNAKENRYWEIIKRWIKNFFTKNIAIKVLSLVFAMLLWGYVLMTDNPERIKSISGIPVNIDGEADLAARRLTLIGGRDSIEEEISVRVRTALTAYADLNAEDITASASLNGIASKGTHSLLISARSSTGQVISISPNTITVEVDKLVTRRIPVEVRTEGELPENYWMGAVQVDRTYIELEGAEQDLADIVRAEGIIDVTNRTESFNQSILLKLYNAAGEEVESSALFGSMATAVARLEIMPTKVVPINVDGALLGRYALPENFEIASYGTALENNVARIVGDEATLEGITSLSLETLDITGMTESVEAELAILLPENVKLIGENTVNVQVVIREKTGSSAFTELPVEVIGLANKQTATLSDETASILLDGRVSLLSGITRGDIEVYADVTGLAAGSHEISLAVRIGGEDVPSDLQCQFVTASTVTVTITE
ncbi:MAG: hypothetical protein E7330_07525 [Clostridiales bacterium]|nr:hypothetical protein [Clostridiales bacterium]